MSREPKLNAIFNETFRYTKKIARNFYFNNWAKSPSRSPAFQDEVINIGREGWEHTVTIARRTRMDVLGRLFCLEKAKYLLETSTTFQDYRKIRDMEFWVFASVIDKTKIKVVVRSIKGRYKHFYSVIRKGSIEEEFVG